MGIPECLTTVKSQTSGNFLKNWEKGLTNGEKRCIITKLSLRRTGTDKDKDEL